VKGTSAAPLVVGLNIGHDGGCAVMRGGEIICAISEERLNRNRYSPGWVRSLVYALETTGATIAEVDLFVFSSGGPNLPQGFDGGLSAFGVERRRVATLDHHASHAWSAHCLSGAEDSTVLVIDAQGNNKDTETWWAGGRHGVHRLGGNDRARLRARGIGFTYEAFTNWLGFPDQESGKTMALAAFGEPEVFRQPLFELHAMQAKGALDATHQWGVIGFAERHRLPFGDPFPDARERRAQDVAAYVQYETERVVTELARSLLSQHPASTLCFSGGVALNCVLNTVLRQMIAPTRLYVPPAASDIGQPLGNALYGHWLLTSEMPSGAPHHGWLGRGYDAAEIRAALDGDPAATPYGRLRRARCYWTIESDPAETAAQLLADGKIIGWHQGGSEFGPRALGHRSILADPRTAVSRDRLNTRIKHREWFRPFAPSILSEHAYELLGADEEYPYMLEAPLLLERWRARLAGVVHEDGTARVQTVQASSDPVFHRLIERFGEKTGVPAVLNTSFNDREPIVETPGDALMTFQASELDALVISNTIVLKRD
jgi:carbamoyltransferase